jgi:hypothetical protein
LLVCARVEFVTMENRKRRSRSGSEKAGAFHRFSAVEVVFEHNQKGVIWDRKQHRKRNIDEWGGRGGPRDPRMGPSGGWPKFRAQRWWLGALVPAETTESSVKRSRILLVTFGGATWVISPLWAKELVFWHLFG